MSNRLAIVFLILLFAAAFIKAASKKDAKSLDFGVEMTYFFINDEFDRSSLAIPQTMTGVHLVPTLDVQFDNSLSLHTGVDLLSLSGSEKSIDKNEFLAWFKYSRKNADLYVGSFDKNNLLSNYNEFFFSDSSKYFRNVMKGVFWNIRTKASYFNMWIDWTGMQTDNDREAFFVGSSAHYSMKNIFLEYQAYMFHFARSRVPTPDMFLYDNALLQMDLGWANGITPQTKLKVFAGLLLGYERQRDGISDAYKSIGLIAGLDLYSNRWGISNLIYFGDEKSVFYNRYADILYWNTPFLRANYYLKSELFFNLINHKYLKGRISSVFRFSEGELMFEQKLLFNLRI